MILLRLRNIKLTMIQRLRLKNMWKILDKNNLKVNTDTSKDGDVEVEIREKDSNK